MDPLTHSAVGAAIAGLITWKHDDVRAPACGALAGALPDIDIIPTLFLGPMSQLDLHRGFTHSILFAVIAAPVLGYFIKRLAGKNSSAISYRAYVLIFLLAMLSHILLDCFTSYGTRIFLPFSDYRVAWGTIAVVDPFFSIPIMLSAISLFLVRMGDRMRRRLFAAGLSISLIYLAGTVFNKAHIDSVFMRSLSGQKIEFSRLMTTPMPLSNFLWVGIAEGGEYYYTGYYSNFDTNDSISFEKDRKNHGYIKDLMGHDQIIKLISFAKDFYTIDPKEGKLVFNDLRYGSLAAGSGEKQFIFSYVITNTRGKPEIVRKARSRVTPDTMAILLKRIAGTR